MPISIMLWVLLAAFLHAAWNLGVKRHEDPAVSMTAIVVGQVPLAIIALYLTALPAWTAWPWLIGGAALHFVYQLSLISAYRLGDLSHVYPLARGAAPLIVTLISLVFLDTPIATLEIAAILLIVVGIFSQLRFNATVNSWPAARLSLLTGLIIAGYTLIDGYGARFAGTGVGFFAVLAITNAALILLAMRWRRPGVVSQVFRSHKRLALQGGSASFIAYAIVVWAFTQAPIALVAALRETSILFAVLLGMIFLKERPTTRALMAVILMIMGLMLLRIAPMLA